MGVEKHSTNQKPIFEKIISIKTYFSVECENRQNMQPHSANTFECQG
jgi:hypothetical protein